MTALTKGSLGEILTSERKFDLAEPFLLECLTDLTLSQADQNPRVIAAKRRLADLYTAWNKPDLAANYKY